MKNIALMILILCAACAQISNNCNFDVLNRFNKSANLGSVVESTTMLSIEINTTGGNQIIEKGWKIRPKGDGCVVWYEVKMSKDTVSSDAKYFIDLERNTIHPDNDLTTKYFYMGQFGLDPIYGPLEGVPLAD